MSTEVSGIIECRPGARFWGPDDEDSVWHAAIDLFLLNNGHAYDALACLFGVRNYFGFRPVAESRGFPGDASEGLQTEYGESPDTHGTTWVTLAELAWTDWQETDSSGTRSRESVAGGESDWGPVWSVMPTLSELHGADHVRLVTWFR
ncbi:hypothetical protein [Streptomyces sp. NPDC002825]|uniref:hypothetical protein n=1 Tax=Streptomyces sp. NPDC002825 TaxID=3154666 RepID=UPI003326F8CF